MSGFATIPLCPDCGGFWREPKNGCVSDFHPAARKRLPDFYDDGTWPEKPEPDTEETEK